PILREKDKSEPAGYKASGSSPEGSVLANVDRIEHRYFKYRKSSTKLGALIPSLNFGSGTGLSCSNRRPIEPAHRSVLRSSGSSSGKPSLTLAETSFSFIRITLVAFHSWSVG